MAAAEPVWLKFTSDGLALLSVHVQPGGRTNAVCGTYGEALKIRLAAPPVDGKANAALIEFVAHRLGVARAQVVLKSGLSSRRKVLEITRPPADLAERLRPEE